MKKIIAVKKKNGLTELQVKRDLKEAVIISSLLLPFPFLAIAEASWWAWGIYVGWWALVCYANFRKPKKKKEFTHIEIEEEKAA